MADARGANTTFGYNNRHLATSISYSVPEGVAATPNVSFAYDAAGNRTSMSDGLGSVSYNYNNLAQLTSETRSFNGLGSYTLSYGYSLAGQLTSITNPWGAQVGYGYDQAGRLTNVSGAGYAGVSNYAGGLSYRAFGSIKGLSYGNGHSLATAYDSRLRPTTWNVSTVLGYNYNYDYFNERTGRVSYAENIQEPTLDRSYEYDHVGRLAISHSGTEARAHAFSGQWGTLDGPYSQGYDHDAWGNVTHKYGWGGEVQGGGAGQSSDIYYTYTGNRRNGFTYDAAGNLSNDGTQSFSYDATGQQTLASSLSGGGSPPVFTDNPLVAGQTTIMAAHLTELRAAVNQVRAGAGLAAASWAEAVASGWLIKAEHIVELRTALDQALGAPSPAYSAGLAQGQPIKKDHIQELRDRVAGWWNGQGAATMYQYYDGHTLRVKKTENAATTYYLRSSVLGGQVMAEIAEINGSGVWQRGFVYAGGNLMAVQQGGVFWMHQDPVTKSKRVTDIYGNIVSTIELDPWGADTSRSSNAAFQPRKFTSYDRDGNGSDEAMFRRFNRKHSRFDQPDPYDGSYSLADPQSLNRYAYTQNDPVNLVDPSGLNASGCPAEFGSCGGGWDGRGGDGGMGGSGFGGGLFDSGRFGPGSAGEAAYVGRLQTTLDGLAAQRALDSGDFDLLAAILNGNENVGLSAGGEEFWGALGGLLANAMGAISGMPSSAVLEIVGVVGEEEEQAVFGGVQQEDHRAPDGPLQHLALEGSCKIVPCAS